MPDDPRLCCVCPEEFPTGCDDAKHKRPNVSVKAVREHHAVSAFLGAFILAPDAGVEFPT